MIGGLYSATLKSVSSIESTLPYLKHYLSFILLDKQSPSSPNPKSTNISSHIPKEDLIPPVLSFKESVNFLSETLFNKNHHIYPMEHDIEWRSKNPEPLETTSRISIIVDNIIYASALRISDCVSIELYDIDPEAFSYSLFVKFPSSLDVPIS
jgi:site-specific recombinase XerD